MTGVLTVGPLRPVVLRLAAVASTSLTALRIPLAAWWSGLVGLVGIWLALSVTAILRGVAMILFWRQGAWRRAKV